MSARPFPQAELRFTATFRTTWSDPSAGRRAPTSPNGRDTDAEGAVSPRHRAATERRLAQPQVV
jgi:hypothetical protein